MLNEMCTVDVLVRKLSNTEDVTRLTSKQQFFFVGKKAAELVPVIGSSNRVLSTTSNVKVVLVIYCCNFGHLGCNKMNTVHTEMTI